MKNRVNITQTKFYVNASQGIVVCVLQVNMQLRKHPSYETFDEDSFMKKLPFVSRQGTFEVKGISKCNVDDVFNEELGKRIAESRAKSKAYTIAAKVYECLSDDLLKESEALTESMAACLFAGDVEDDHIKELIGQKIMTISLNDKVIQGKGLSLGEVLLMIAIQNNVDFSLAEVELKNKGLASLKYNAETYLPEGLFITRTGNDLLNSVILDSDKDVGTKEFTNRVDFLVPQIQAIYPEGKNFNKIS